MMIRILDRYIARAVILSTLLAGLVITGILFLLSLLSELKSMGEGDYGLWQAVQFVVFRMPNQIYQFSPMLILLGSVIGLSTLSSHRELSVMRAAGFSTRQISQCVFKAALILILFLTAIGELVAPNLSYTAETKKENAQNAGQAVITASGVWFHVDNNFIHVDRVVRRQLLEGITRYQFDNEHRLQEAYYAKRLSYEDGRWTMYDVVKTLFYGDRTRSVAMPSMDWNLKLNLNLLNVGLVDPNEMTLGKLHRFSAYLKQNGLQASEYQYEYWQRIFKPFAALIMVMLAIPFVLGAFSTAPMGWRIVVGILVGFIFFISNSLLGELSIVYQVPPILAALFPLIIFFFIAFYLSKQLIRR